MNVAATKWHFGPLAFAGILLTGCLPLHQQRVEGRFSGLRSACEPVPGATNTFHLLIVHGMGIHPVGYSDPLVSSLANALRLTKLEEATIPAGTNQFLLGRLRESVYANQHQRLRVYEVTWSPATEQIKRRAFSYDIAQGRDRQLVNHWLKESLMDLSLSDAVLYAGRYRPQIQLPVRFAIEQLRNHLGPDDRIAMITLSLGSYILFDTLQQIDSEQNAARTGHSIQDLAGRTVQIFMLANQLPLLELSDLTRPGASSERALVSESPAADSIIPSNPLRQFLSWRQDGIRAMRIEPGQSLPPLEVAAFTDPNDLLSYKLRSSDVNSQPFANVTMTIANWSIAGVVANPFQAHTGWIGDRRALRLIIDGSESTRGKAREILSREP